MMVKHLLALLAFIATSSCHDPFVAERSLPGWMRPQRWERTVLMLPAPRDMGATIDPNMALGCNQPPVDVYNSDTYEINSRST